jgi:hypothetical protein
VTTPGNKEITIYCRFQYAVLPLYDLTFFFGSGQHENNLESTPMIEPPPEDSSTLIIQHPQDSPEILETPAVASENMRSEKKSSGAVVMLYHNHNAPVLRAIPLSDMIAGIPLCCLSKNTKMPPARLVEEGAYLSRCGSS